MVHAIKAVSVNEINAFNIHLKCVFLFYITPCYTQYPFVLYLNSLEITAQIPHNKIRHLNKCTENSAHVHNLDCHNETCYHSEFPFQQT